MMVGQDLKDNAGTGNLMFPRELSLGRNLDEPVPPWSLILRHQDAVVVRYLSSRQRRRNPQQHPATSQQRSQSHNYDLLNWLGEARSRLSWSSCQVSSNP